MLYIDITMKRVSREGYAGTEGISSGNQMGR